MNKFFDLIIIGAGVAGLSALLATDKKQKVAVITVDSPERAGSSWRAQGGVAVALGSQDSPALHARDTLAAARHMACPEAIRVLTQEGPLRVRELLNEGLLVDRSQSGEILFGLEAAHTRARVIHHHDRTGKSLIAHLWQRAQKRENTFFYRDRVTRILAEGNGVSGVLLARDEVLNSPRVILASGGFAGLYQGTTTGREVQGDGIALALEVGAQVRDLEFVQFHPTALEVDTDGPLPLLTEALRGAGATLQLESGERFVKELLGRDEVARAIAQERAQGRTVYLDVSRVRDLSLRFPSAFSQMTEGQLRKLRLPVRPAAHYTIGGVWTSLHGATTVPGLYAVGEVASVGIHGANRLASNSLLEGLVFGRRAGRHSAGSLRTWTPAPALPPLKRMTDESTLRELRCRFEEGVGVVRTSGGIENFLDWLETLDVTMESTVAAQVANAALTRSESVGAHFRADFQSVPALPSWGAAG